MTYILNIVQHPRSTILGLIGSTGGGAALLFLLNAMHCDLSQLSWQTVSTVASMILTPAVVGAGMRDTVQEAAHASPTA